MKSYALRFISGKYQGGEFPLPLSREVIVGRSSDLDMVLVEDMVSRRHAKIMVNGEYVVIQDMDSTNGTFVNGERIKRAKLSEGDRVLIGTSIMKVVQSDESTDVAVESPRLEEVAAHRRTSQVRTMTGSIEEIPLPDLLQLFSSSKKTGTLVIRTDTDVGKLHLDDGRLIFASLNDDDEIKPEKAVYRILCWQHGTFYMETAEQREFPGKLEMSTEGVLIEAMRRLDELRRIEGMPEMQARLSLIVPMAASLTDLEPADLQVLQLAHNHRLIETILNNSNVEDMELCQRLTGLIKRGYLQVD